MAGFGGDRPGPVPAVRDTPLPSPPATLVVCVPPPHLCTLLGGSGRFRPALAAWEEPPPPQHPLLQGDQDAVRRLRVSGGTNAALGGPSLVGGIVSVFFLNRKTEI